MYEITLNQIAAKLTEMQKLFDEGCDPEECDILKELHIQTTSLFNELGYFEYLNDLEDDSLIPQKSVKEFEQFKKLEKDFHNLNVQFDLGKETNEDIVEATLDSMFPNRHDDDFDEDDMSYNQVFGDD